MTLDVNSPRRRAEELFLFQRAIQKEKSKAVSPTKRYDKRGERCNAVIYIAIPLGIPRKATNAVADAEIDVPDELAVLYGVASSFYPHQTRRGRKLKKQDEDKAKPAAHKNIRYT